MGFFSALFGSSDDGDESDDVAARQRQNQIEQDLIAKSIRTQSRNLTNAQKSLSSLENRLARYEYGTSEYEDADRHVQSARCAVEDISSDLHTLEQQLNDRREEYVRIGNGG